MSDWNCLLLHKNKFLCKFLPYTLTAEVVFLAALHKTSENIESLRQARRTIESPVQAPVQSSSSQGPCCSGLPPWKFEGWNLQNFTGQPASLLGSPHGETFFPSICYQSPLFIPIVLLLVLPHMDAKNLTVSSWWLLWWLIICLFSWCQTDFCLLFLYIFFIFFIYICSSVAYYCITTEIHC